MEIHDETYVSLETAKLLKKAGFDWECSGHWVETNKDNKDALLVLPSEPCLYDSNLVDDNLNMYMICVKDYNAVEDEIGFQFYYSAPTLAVTQKWLREVKGIRFYITPKYYSHYNDKGEFTHESFAWYEGACDDFDDLDACNISGLKRGDKVIEEGVRESVRKTYEEVLEEGIQKCLTILLEEKKDE